MVFNEEGLKTRVLTMLQPGRKEILAFFYTYMLLTFFSLLVDAGVVPPGNDAYPYFVSIQNGFSSALITCLLINGFVGFQLYEDGTPLSVWLLRLCSVVAFALSFLISLATFKDWAGMGPTQTVGLFTVLYLLNAIQLFVYIVLQIILVMRTLEDRWPLAAIIFGVLFFVIGQVLLYGLSAIICNNASHYIDGLSLATTCNLLAVMMVYKVRTYPSPYGPSFKALSSLTRIISTGIPLPRRIWSSLLVPA